MSYGRLHYAHLFMFRRQQPKCRSNLSQGRVFQQLLQNSIKSFIFIIQFTMPGLFLPQAYLTMSSLIYFIENQQNFLQIRWLVKLIGKEDRLKFNDGRLSFIIGGMLIQRLVSHVNNNIRRILGMNSAYLATLKLKNSLTNQLEQFVPLDGKNVFWYTCGPTVYSNSHMGHARNYISNDMIRRVLSKHFGYNVRLAMNVTDVDDKIINNSKLEGIQYFEFARKWEADFFEDMENLGVEKPDYLTRVTEYMPEIISYIENIIQNGYAYESNGSVYFNIEEYKKKFKYGKLKRVKDAETEADQADQKNQKRNKEDFALWKAAKPGEPAWKSKWGPGRPGWHIECSAMAGAIFGKKLDIHSGGIDLIFPHHENQIAQSEAHNNEADWVKYFIHVGHLHIKGCKMSKSLKNFITIKTLIKQVPPRVIKLFFAMHRYDVVLDYDPATSLQEAETKDKRYKNFFGALKTIIRDTPISKPQKIDQTDSQFDKVLQATKQKIHEELCNNIHTPGVIDAVDEAIKKANIYLSSPSPKATLLEKALRVLSSSFDQMGLSYAVEGPNDSKNKEIIDAVVKFRSNIRQNAKGDFKKILQICDNFRDDEMVELQIRLEDKQVTEPSTWRYESKEVMIKQRQKKLQDQRKKQEEKRKKEEQKIKKMSVNPIQMFRTEKKFTKFDQKGIPTHQKQKDGERPLKQEYRKTLVKKWDDQKALYDKYLVQHAPKQQKNQQKQQQASEQKKQEEKPAQK